jgi:hypothetical protein
VTMLDAHKYIYSGLILKGMESDKRQIGWCSSSFIMLRIFLRSSVVSYRFCDSTQK